MEIIKNRIVTVNFEMTLSTLCGIRVPVNVGGFTQLQASHLTLDIKHCMLSDNEFPFMLCFRDILCKALCLLQYVMSLTVFC